MRKALIAVLAITYIWISGGVVFSMHYCGGVIAEIQPAITGTADCCSAMPEQNNCCHDKLVSVKLNEAHYCSPKLQIETIEIAVPILTNSIKVHTHFDNDTDVNGTFFANNSPPRYNNHLCVFTQVFII